MPRRPAADERLVVPECSGASKERIYLRDLAKFLHLGVQTLRKVAKRYGYLRFGPRGPQMHVVEYVSVYAAMRLIAWGHAIQGEIYLQGENFHRTREQGLLSERRCKGRKRSGHPVTTEQEKLNVQS